MCLVASAIKLLHLLRHMRHLLEVNIKYAAQLHK